MLLSIMLHILSGIKPRTCSGIELVRPYQVVAQACAVVVKRPDWRSEIKVEIAACGQERLKQREKQE